MRRVVVTGSLAFDHVMNLPGKFRDHILPEKLHILNVSFLVDSLRTEKGGTGGNIAYNLALLGVKPKLVGALGKDGVSYKKWLQSTGIDVAGVKVFSDEKTAVGHAVTDNEDNQIWLFYKGAMSRSDKLPLGLTARTGLVVIAPNDPGAVVKYVDECVERELDYMYDPAFQIPHYSKAQLGRAIKNARIIVGNDYEVALMRKKLTISNKKIINMDQIWITTLGSKGSVIEQGKKKWRIPAAKPKNTSDPTGAGDAYRAGFVAGYLRDLPLSVCGKMGSVCAVYTVEKYGTQTHRFTLSSFKRRYSENFSKTLSL